MLDKVFGKVFDFLFMVVEKAILSLFVAFFFYIILAILYFFAMIPVSIVAGEGVANTIHGYMDSGFIYKVLYLVVLVLSIIDGLGVFKFKNILKGKRATAKLEGK